MTAVGLVLSAGGPTATAFHAGALAALAGESGWSPGGAEVIVGTSAGSSAAAMLRAGFPPADEYARVTGGELSLAGQEFASRVRDAADRAESGDAAGSAGPLSVRLGINGLLLKRRPGVALAGFSTRGRQSLARSGAAARAALNTWPNRPTWIVTVRTRDGARAVFGRDDLPQTDIGTAIEASSAVPSLYRPIRIGRDEFVDGAVHSSTNADLVAGLGLDAVVVVSSMTAVPARASCLHRNPTRSYFSRVLAQEVTRIRAAGTPVLVIQPTAADLAVRTGVDDAAIKAIAEQARASARVRIRRADAGAVMRALEGAGAEASR